MEVWTLEDAMEYTYIRTIGIEIMNLRKEKQTKENKKRLDQLINMQRELRKKFIKLCSSNPI